MIAQMASTMGACGRHQACPALESGATVVVLGPGHTKMPSSGEEEEVLALKWVNSVASRQVRDAQGTSGRSGIQGSDRGVT